MRPGLVDEILTGMAGRSDVSSAFAPRHNMVPACGHLPATKCANLVHTVGPIFVQKHIYSCRLRHHSFKKFRTPGWSLPPAHPRAFGLEHDSTTSDSRSIGASKQCPVRLKERGARASSRSGVQKLARRAVARDVWRAPAYALHATARQSSLAPKSRAKAGTRSGNAPDPDTHLARLRL